VKRRLVTLAAIALLGSCAAREQRMHPSVTSTHTYGEARPSFCLRDDTGERPILVLYSVQAGEKLLVVADIAAYESGRVLLRTEPNATTEFWTAQLPPADVQECARFLVDLAPPERPAGVTDGSEPKELFVWHAGDGLVLTPAALGDADWSQAVERVSRLAAQAWERKAGRIRVEIKRE
jgi:hypothetical protein